MRRGRSQTWSQVQRFPSVVYNEEVPGGTSRIQTRSDRKARPSQQPPLLSLLTSSSLLSLRLYLGCSSVTFTLLFLPGCLRARGSERRTSVFERQRRCNQSEWNPKTQQKRKGDRLSPHHVQTENTEGEAVLCFCGCLDFGNRLRLRCSLQALAGGHSSMGRRRRRGGYVCEASAQRRACITTA